jgi:outer membrane lipopolysaccharide assembly protein LptE/RlpB
MKIHLRFFLFPLIIFLLLPSCSGGGFHLRESTRLSGAYQNIVLQGISTESKLYTTLKQSIKEAGGDVVPLVSANSIIVINNLKEDKKIVAYTRERIAREYMVYLHFDYQIKIGDKEREQRLIRLDKTLIYDSNFVLGKAEEESRIQQSLREEAARLILLRLRYSKQ